jgi:hypothetical protein
VSVLEIAALVTAVFVTVGLVLGAVLVLVLPRMKRGSEQFVADLEAELAETDEEIVAGPEAANYRGGTGGHSAVKGNGTIVLTDRRLLFRKLSGGMVEIPTSAITGTREETTYLGSRVGGQTCLVVETDEPAEIGLFVTDRAAWRVHLSDT